MNYNKIIINGYNEKINQKTSYVSYFKSQAQIIKRDNFVEFSDFFNGCKLAIGRYKKEIEKQYNSRLHENDRFLRSYYQALQKGQTTDQKGEPIQSYIDYIENDKEFFIRQGYENSRDYAVGITEDGNIAEHSYDIKYQLYYSDIDQLEKAIAQTEQELISNDQHQGTNIVSEANTNEANTDKPQQNESIKGYFKYKTNENYIIDYLTELKSIFDFTEKLTFGGVCLALYERNLHKKDIKSFTKFMEILANYWNIELPKDKRKNKYKNKKSELIYQYAILNRELK